MSRIRSEQEIWFSKASPALTSLESVFKKLRWVHQRYITAEGSEDILYGHGERPHVGLLAAAWLDGKTALEEYRCEKGARGKAKYGRVDLYIRMGKGKATFGLEAKHVMANLGTDDTKTLVEKIRKKLGEARSQAATLPTDEGDRHLGLVFVTPKISREECKSLDQRLRDLKKSLKEPTALPYEALVWTGMMKGGKPLGDKHSLYPGLLLVIKEARKSTAAISGRSAAN